jgi:hypothetical protein
MRIAVIQKTSITGFVTAPVPEVHRDLHGRQSASTSSSSCSLDILRLSLLSAVSPLADFSFDYQDLLLKPAEKKP